MKPVGRVRYRCEGGVGKDTIWVSSGCGNDRVALRRYCARVASFGEVRHPLRSDVGACRAICWLDKTLAIPLLLTSRDVFGAALKGGR